MVHALNAFASPRLLPLLLILGLGACDDGGEAPCAPGECPPAGGAGEPDASGSPGPTPLPPAGFGGADAGSGDADQEAGEEADAAAGPADSAGAPDSGGERGDGGGDPVAPDTGGGAPDTRVPPGGGAETCAELIVCTGGCGPDTACHIACDESASADAKSELAAFEACTVTSCGGLSGTAYLRCGFESCQAETMACWAGGDEPCLDTLRCLAPCPGAANVEACVAGCAGKSTEAAVTTLGALWACVDDQCDDDSELCLAGAYFACSGHGAACGALSGSAGCTATLQCLDACNDSLCFVSCYEQASLGDATKVAALTSCLYQTCGAEPTEACAEAAVGLGGPCSSAALSCFF